MIEDREDSQSSDIIVTDTERPGVRAVIRPDYDYPLEWVFDGDAEAPVLYRDYSGGVRAMSTPSQTPAEEVTAWITALERFGSESEKFDRYVRAYFGATTVDYVQDRDGEFVTFDPKTWREAIGAPEGSTSVETLRAVRDGNIYYITSERKVTWTKNGTDESREEWETVESVSGMVGYNRDDLIAEAASLIPEGE